MLSMRINGSRRTQRRTLNRARVRFTTPRIRSGATLLGVRICPMLDSRSGFNSIASGFLVRLTYEQSNSPGCSCPSRSSRWFSVKPPKILDLVNALLFAQEAPCRKCVGHVVLSSFDLILEADNFCGEGNRLTTPLTRCPAVAHGRPLLGLSGRNATSNPGSVPRAIQYSQTAISGKFDR